MIKHNRLTKTDKNDLIWELLLAWFEPKEDWRLALVFFIQSLNLCYQLCTLIKHFQRSRELFSTDHYWSRRKRHLSSC